MSVASSIKQKLSGINVMGIATVVGVGVAGYYVYQYLKRKLPPDKQESYPVSFELPKDMPGMPAIAEAVSKARKGKKPKKQRRVKPSPELAFPNPMNPYNMSGLAGMAGLDCGANCDCPCNKNKNG
jgi:hypothetical protein